MPQLRFGLKLAPQLTNVDELRAVWRIADDEGFDHVWNFDHFCAIAGDPVADVLEGWTLLGAMAEATSRVQIGCMVTGNTYRHPGVLAKMAVTVDHLSGGRLLFGIGAAWAEIEHRQFDLEFEASPGRRIARLAEACVIFKDLWTKERTSFDGRYYTVTDAIANPKPIQKPYPPIWIGGSGERKTLRVVAEHADVWNGGGDPDEAARLSGVLDRHCEDVGRDPAEVLRSVQLRFAPGGEDDEVLTRTQEYVERGFTEIIIVVPGGQAEPEAERMARLLPGLRGLG
jgi:F420-dependent oxidoreductase-like protein